MQALKTIGALLVVFITLPIWFFLLYKILQAVDASELMWFLYWIYLPVSTLVAVLVKLSVDE
jgi:hypothetical protein